MTGAVFIANNRTLRHSDELIELFESGCKPESERGIGLEYERLPIEADTGRAAAYAGARGVEGAHGDLAGRFSWTAEFEAGRVIGLQRDGSLVSLEPGGQLELSARVHRDLGSVRDELARYLRETSIVGQERGIIWVPIGLHPLSGIEEIAWVPKGRYAIMAPFLGARGSLAHHMMKATAGCQLNFDYTSESDAAEKLRLAMGVTSIVTAAFANSPLSGGSLTGHASHRARIWLDTDPARCGLLELAFRGDATFREYLEYAMDVPVIFIRRNDRWIPLDGIPFRRFLADGSHGIRATLADWALHLTTIFTEVRLKTYLEVRGADSVAPELAISLSALWKGLLYDAAARRDAWSLVARPAFAQRVAFHREVCDRGPDARLDGVSAHDLAKELVAIARSGLDRQAETSPQGVRVEESAFLVPLEESLGSEGGCPAASLARNWSADPRAAMTSLLSDVSRAASAFAEAAPPP